ncbi:MAG: hypothetical protein A3K09_07060 [Nitrospinae bacterium RIFCSPLOWO2_12_FULL_47_7]|nr:MAG: hypothetical protein A3K09_07060 [Nitrospinae bacterium RIFCSPLOWO2_12_FULL_47_7]
MKMNHLSKETVETLMDKIHEVIASNDYSAEAMEIIFRLSEVKGDLFLKCKENAVQAQNVNFELDKEKGIRFFDPFSFFTGGIYKDVDGWTRWTVENLKEPWT